MNTAQTIGANPVGFMGTLAGVIMNLVHRRFYEKTVKKYLDGDTGGEFVFLDIGCGGGQALACLCARFPRALVHGIDHSPEMTRLARKVNRRGVREGRVRVEQASADALPYRDSSFDAVTAFDTINFWGDIDASLAEVKRVLKPGGMFLVVNAYPKEGTKWHDFVRFKNDAEYRKALVSRGFGGVLTEVVQGSVIVRAFK